MSTDQSFWVSREVLAKSRLFCPTMSAPYVKSYFELQLTVTDQLVPPSQLEPRSRNFRAMNVIEGRRGGESLGLLYNTSGDETTEATHQTIENSGSIDTGSLEGMQEVKGSIDRHGGVITETDDRSSSLSEIEDGTVAEVLENGKAGPTVDADGNDTEAETERLEDSPQKLRSYKNVVLTTSNNTDHVEVHVNGTEVLASGQQTPS